MNAKRIDIKECVDILNILGNILFIYLMYLFNTYIGKTPGGELNKQLILMHKNITHQGYIMKEVLSFKIFFLYSQQYSRFVLSGLLSK